MHGECVFNPIYLPTSAPHPHHDHSQHFPRSFFLSHDINLFCGTFFPFYPIRLNSKRCIMINFALFSCFCRCDPPPLSHHATLLKQALKLSKGFCVFKIHCTMAGRKVNWWCRASCHKLIHWAEHDSILFTQRQTFFSFSLLCAYRPSWQVWSESHGRHRLKRQLSSTPNLLLHRHSSTSTSRPSWEVSSSTSNR